MRRPLASDPAQKAHDILRTCCTPDAKGLWKYWRGSPNVCVCIVPLAFIRMVTPASSARP